MTDNPLARFMPWGPFRSIDGWPWCERCGKQAQQVSARYRARIIQAVLGRYPSADDPENLFRCPLMPFTTHELKNNEQHTLRWVLNDPGGCRECNGPLEWVLEPGCAVMTCNGCGGMFDPIWEREQIEAYETKKRRPVSVETVDGHWAARVREDYW